MGSHSKEVAEFKSQPPVPSVVSYKYLTSRFGCLQQNSNKRQPPNVTAILEFNDYY